MSSLRQGVRSWPSLGDWTCLYFSVSIYKIRIRPFLAAPQGDYKRVEAQAPPPPTHTPLNYHVIWDWVWGELRKAKPVHASSTTTLRGIIPVSTPSGLFGSPTYAMCDVICHLSNDRTKNPTRTESLSAPKINVKLSTTLRTKC